MVRACLLLLSFALLGVRASAAENGGKRLALVIGNGSYRDVEGLPNAASDARLIAGTLQAQGFVLVGGGPQLNLDRTHFVAAVQALGRALRGADVGVFYYAGHGVQARGVNWLLPVDAKPDRSRDLGPQAVEVTQVLRQMEGTGTRLNLVLLDACRDNPFAVPGPDAMRPDRAEMHVPANTLISYATQANSVAIDGPGANGPYARALAAVLREPGLGLTAAFDRVGTLVQRDTGGMQRPLFEVSMRGTLNFAGTMPTRQVPALPPAEPGCFPWIAGLKHCDRPLHDLTTRGIRLVRPEIEVLQAFSSEPTSVLGALIRNTREAADGPLIQLSQRTVTAGESLSLTLRGAAGAAIALDLFRADNTVQHVPLKSVATEGNDVRLSTAPADMPHGGAALLVAVVSPARLTLGTRPHIERASLYLSALQRELGAGGGLRADMALLDVQPAPVPATAALPAAAPQPVRPPVRSPRCRNILERAQLGDEISDSDRAFLRTACR